MSGFPKQLYWILPLVMLTGAVVMQILAASQSSLSKPAPALAATIPSQLPGWSARELPLGETEELRNAVAFTLKFDEYFSRAYTRGAITITLYVAYWRPDKVPPRAVGVHTPDTCWVQNGWSRSERLYAVNLAAPGGNSLKPAEFGIYTMQGISQHVYFWHLVGGKPYSYEQEGLHSLTAPFQDMAAFGLKQRREQLFVRLASNVPFNEIWLDPGFARLLESLSELGLGKSSES